MAFAEEKCEEGSEWEKVLWRKKIYIGRLINDLGLSFIYFDIEEGTLRWDVFVSFFVFLIYRMND